MSGVVDIRMINSPALAFIDSAGIMMPEVPKA